MHQESWVYRGKLKKHLVQLSHDFAEGTLLLTLNGTELAEDRFNAEKEKKKFSFFIDGELCEINITQKDKKYFYQFVPHIYSTSEVGKKRKKAAKWELVSVNTGIALVSIGLLFAVVYFNFFSNSAAPALSLGGITTTATIQEINANKRHTIKNEAGVSKTLNGNIRYSFEVAEETYYGDAYLYKKIQHYYLSQTGLPIQTGDQFLVLYDQENPNVNTILFDRPSPEKLEQYQLYAREACLSNVSPEVPTQSSLQHCECLRAYLFQQYGLEGLAQILHQATRKTLFADFNEETYQKFMSEERQQEILEICESLINK